MTRWSDDLADDQMARSLDDQMDGWTDGQKSRWHIKQIL